MPEKQLMSPLDSTALQTLIDNAADGEQIRTLTREEISNTAHVVAEINQEVGAELVMHDEAALALFVNNLENTRNKHEFRERLEYTSIGAAIKNWLSNLATETARNYGRKAPARSMRLVTYHLPPTLNG